MVRSAQSSSTGQTVLERLLLGQTPSLGPFSWHDVKVSFPERGYNNGSHLDKTVEKSQAKCLGRLVAAVSGL